MRLFAPAKINLSLEVLGKRTDGYHEVRTVLQAIDLADEVTIDREDLFSLRIEPTGAVPIEGNLVLRAAEALREAAGVTEGAAIVLRKRVPVAAGLGGGSSDAAATLLGLRSLWGVDRDKSLVYRIAASLGSDVPFFLRGGTALGTGRGDALELLGMPVERHAVVVTPLEAPDAAKTSRLYGLLRPEHFTDGSSTDEVVRRISAGEPVGPAMHNAFANVAEQAYAKYGDACTMLRAAGAEGVLLSGAGPAVFALAQNRAIAETIAWAVRSEGFEARAVRLLGPWSSEGLKELP